MQGEDVNDSLDAIDKKIRQLERAMQVKPGDADEGEHDVEPESR